MNIPSDLFTTLRNASVPCLYALINDFDKKVYISHGQSLLSSLERNIEQINSRSHKYKDLMNDVDKLRVVVLEYIKDPELQKMRLKHWCDEYKNKGYTLYRNYTGVKYKLITTIEEYGGKYYIFVKLKNNYRKIVVGVFDKSLDSKKFIEDNYKNNIVSIVYAENELTKEYKNSLLEF